VNELRTWLAHLVADDQAGELLDDKMKLAAIDAYPTPAPDAVRITVAACKPPYECPKSDVLVSARGELYGGADTLEEGAALLSNDLRALAAGSAALLIDKQVSWRSLAMILGAIGNAGVRHVAIAFVAGKTHAAAPGPSSIDAPLAAFLAKENADLERDPAGTLERTMNRPGPPAYVTAVYATCPQASELVSGILSERIPSENKPKAIAEQLPDAVVACNCKIEINALERLIWQLFSRDEHVPLAWVNVELAPGGATFAAPVTATWATMHDQLVAASRGKPLAF
jgi:hypothetical protein